MERPVPSRTVRPMKVTRFVLAFVAVASPALGQNPELPAETTDSFTNHDPLLRSMRDVSSHTLTSIRKKPASYRLLPV